jgi:hypothetical protein
MYIVTVQYSRAPNRIIAATFQALREALLEVYFQLQHNRSPRLYHKEVNEREGMKGRASYRGSVLSGAQEVDLGKMTKPKKAARAVPKIKTFPWDDMHKVASVYAKADVGDPFCYDRAMSHIVAGSAKPEDYEKGGRA